MIVIEGKKYLKPFKINIGGDPSSAAFFTTLTLLNQNSSLKIKNVGLNPTRIGFYNILNLFYQNNIGLHQKRPQLT